MNKKRAQGRFYTKGNPFELEPFKQWAEQAGLRNTRILEPFAGANNIIHMLENMGMCSDYRSYDIAPASQDVKKRDTIKKFPAGFDVCVTNPPWLARNSATRRGLPFCGNYDDLYKRCLELCLHNCRHVAALIPASCLQSGLFQERLSTYILLHEIIFDDTENPVCLALFNDEESEDVNIYYDNRYIGKLNSLSNLFISVFEKRNNRHVRFNDPHGELGFISFDNTKEPSIHFCRAKDIKDYPIKISSRFITRISGEFDNVPVLVNKLNRRLRKFRRETKDVFLTPFKGIRDDGWYRRRMCFSTARKLINAA